MKKVSSLVSMALLLGACNVIPPQEYYDRGSPYSLLDTSSEVVNVSLVSEDSVNEVVQWVDQDQPSQADLACMEGEPVCAKTLETLESFRVPVNFTSSPDNTLTLVYDRVVARDCENRYIDNSINPYNLNHRTFGCSTAVNMVQMVGDKRQFTNPPIMDFRDGERAAQDYNSYLRPYDLGTQAGTVSGESLVKTAGSN